eukprot:6209032-Prymnesium_polylepis.1
MGGGGRRGCCPSGRDEPTQTYKMATPPHPHARLAAVPVLSSFWPPRPCMHGALLPRHPRPSPGALALGG